MNNFNILAAGDSWNDYPKILLTGGGLATHLAKLLDCPYTNIAHAGDATIVTMGEKDSTVLEANLPGHNVLLFSGGGDDICGDQFSIWLNQNIDGNINNAINWTRLDAALTLTIADYEDLTDVRDRIAPDCLILTHSYDFPTKDKLGVGILWLGPWLKPGLDWCGWTNLDDQVNIVKLILTEFNRRLSNFAQTNRLHLHINTQGTLSAEDWQNEIHPNSQGWDKLASVLKNGLLNYNN